MPQKIGRPDGGERVGMSPGFFEDCVAVHGNDDYALHSPVVYNRH